MQYLLLHYGYAFLVVGLIIEGDATLIAAAILAGQQILDLRWVVGLGMAVTVLGNEALFEIGATGHLKRLVNPRQRERVQRWLHNSHTGLLTLLFSRFMWGFRLIIPLGAGMTHVRRRRFALTNLCGGIVWVLLLTFFGVGLQEWFASLQANVVHHQQQIAVGLFLVGMAAGIVSLTWSLTWRMLRRPTRNLLSLVEATRTGRASAGAGKPAASGKSSAAEWTPLQRPSGSSPVTRTRHG